MTEICKLLFDLSLYYTLSGFYLMLFGQQPSAALFGILVLTVLLDTLRRAAFPRFPFLRPVILLLPAGLLLLAALHFLPEQTGPVQLLQAVPAAVYLADTFRRNLVDTDYDHFRAQFLMGCRLLLIMIPGFIFFGRAWEGLQTVLPWLLLMLLSGIFLLRLLRDNRRSGVRQAVYLLIFILLGIALYAGGVLQQSARLLSWLYSHVLAGVFLVLAMLLAYAFFYVVVGFYKLLQLLSAPGAQNNEKMEQFITEFREEPIVEQGSAAVPEVLKMLALLLLAGLLILMLVRLFQSLQGRGLVPAAKRNWTERRESLGRENSRAAGFRLFRPADPALAVRYYYAKFLRECRKRRISAAGSMTSEEIAALAAPAFTGADPVRLQQIYVRARYGDPGQVDEKDAKLAEQIWKELKNAPDPHRAARGAER